ncbi:hypothetical protein FrEUN1fDRAFT_0219 [Parafrankia sp. EUN1f]|nr:hypothetical protein FrEUN1fDRAFT_0219 [Parafrankia sp. EUN1f]
MVTFSENKSPTHDRRWQGCARSGSTQASVSGQHDHQSVQCDDRVGVTRPPATIRRRRRSRRPVVGAGGHTDQACDRGERSDQEQALARRQGQLARGRWYEQRRHQRQQDMEGPIRDGRTRTPCTLSAEGVLSARVSMPPSVKGRPPSALWARDDRSADGAPVRRSRCATVRTEVRDPLRWPGPGDYVALRGLVPIAALARGRQRRSVIDDIAAGRRMVGLRAVWMSEVGSATLMSATSSWAVPAALVSRRRLPHRLRAHRRRSTPPRGRPGAA